MENKTTAASPEAAPSQSQKSVIESCIRDMENICQNIRDLYPAIDNMPSSRFTSKKLNLQNCYFTNVSYICNANSFNNRVIHGNYQFSDKKAAYGCESRDFSTIVETVCGDRLSFINSKNF